MGDRKSAIDFYNAAVTSVNERSNPEHLKHAYQLFSSACVADPTYPEAWYQCGNNNSDLGHYPAAIACWRHGLESVQEPSERAKILCNLGWRLHALGRIQEALEVSTDALRLDAGLIYTWVNLSCIYGTLDDPEKSVACARHAYDLMRGKIVAVRSPDDPAAEIDHSDAVVEMALTFALLQAGHYAEGLKHFESRFRYKLKNFLQFPYPKWKGETGKTIYLVADQGLGDTISFSRFVEAAAQRCKYIHAAVQPDLLRLFTHAFLHLPNVNIIPQPCPFPQADCWSTFVSLPPALGLTDAEIIAAPHIKPPHIVNPVNWLMPDRKLHVGIAWAGSPLNEIDKHRNIPLSNFLELYNVPGVQLYSLQVGPKAQELYDQGCLALIRDLTPYIRDVVDTIGMLSKLDLVITCESALGHICALADHECWIPYSHLGRDYRAGICGDAKLWTPHHTFIRQGADCSWTPVFKRIADELRLRVEKVKNVKAA